MTMFRLIIILLTSLVMQSLLFAQDENQIAKYYEFLGKPSAELIDSWGYPLYNTTSEYGGQIYSYQWGFIDTKFYLNNNYIYAASFTLDNINADVFGTITLYAIFKAKLINNGFTEIASFGNPISSIFSNGFIKVTMELTQENSNRYSILSYAVFTE